MTSFFLILRYATIVCFQCMYPTCTIFREDMYAIHPTSITCIRASSYCTTATAISPFDIQVLCCMRFYALVPSVMYTSPFGRIRPIATRTQSPSVLAYIHVLICIKSRSTAQLCPTLCKSEVHNTFSLN